VLVLVALLVPPAPFSGSLLAGPPAGVIAPAARGEIIEGTQTHTAPGGGAWQAWFNASGAGVLGANAQAIWFVKGGCLWRYNVPRKQVDVWTTPLTHPDINSVMLSGAVSAGASTVPSF